jgi:hypothetical protein
MLYNTIFTPLLLILLKTKSLRLCFPLRLCVQMKPRYQLLVTTCCTDGWLRRDPALAAG